MPALPGTVAVLGAGTMGAGIGTVFALGGSTVRIASRAPATRQRCEARVRDIAQSLDPAGADTALERIALASTFEEALAGAELVVETIVEDVAPKRELLALAERMTGDDAILVSNTSSLPLDSLASRLDRPARFAGLHWFNPPELVELVEVVGSSNTAPSVVETLASWMTQLGKAPVVLRRDVPGFVANRLQYALLREAWSLVESGVCDYGDVDRAVTHGLGARWAAIGPFQTVDLAGLDVHLAVVKNLFPAIESGTAIPGKLRDAVGDGALGAKAGRGLLGPYEPSAVEALAARRNRILAILTNLHMEEA